MVKILLNKEDEKMIKEIANRNNKTCLQKECNECILNHFTLNTDDEGTCKEIAESLLNLIKQQNKIFYE